MSPGIPMAIQPLRPALNGSKPLNRQFRQNSSFGCRRRGPPDWRALRVSASGLPVGVRCGCRRRGSPVGVRFGCRRRDPQLACAAGAVRRLRVAGALAGATRLARMPFMAFDCRGCRFWQAHAASAAHATRATLRPVHFYLRLCICGWRAPFCGVCMRLDFVP